MLSSTEIERRIRAFARELAEEFVEIPWEDDFVSPYAAIEAKGAELGDLVARELGEQLARRQSETRLPAAESCCPECHSPGELKRLGKRPLQTTRGQVQLSEPEHYCKKCRRSFFPSDAVDRS